MEIINDSSESPEAFKRPKLLNVVCILTFIGCALIFLGTIVNIIMDTPERREESIENTRRFSPAMADQLEEQYQEMEENVWYQIQPYISILMALVTFLGAFMMFKGKKNGFYIYLAAEFIPYSFMLFAGSKGMAVFTGGGSMQTAAIAGTIMVIVLDITFAVLYGMNLKHLK